MSAMRDRLAHAICNWVLNHIATPWYRDMLDGTPPRVWGGMSSAYWYEQTCKRAREVAAALARATAAEERERALEGRIRSLADWHDTKAMKARRFPGEGREALMEKAAQVHDDAAARLRALLDAKGDEG